MAESKDVIIIDGGMLEGGGQILRNSAALSCLLGQPIIVNNIRAGRNNPGLRPQHLTGLQLIRDLCGGKLKGDRVGSSEITFHPGQIKGGNFVADTKTAGSICLLMQAAMPCLFYADKASSLVLRGGTNAEMAPQIDFTTMVFRPIAEQFGMKFDCDIRRRGYFPKGGGDVKIMLHPSKKLKPITMTTRGQVTKVHIRSFVAGVVPIRVADSTARSAINALKAQYKDIVIDKDIVKEPDSAAVGTGSGIIIVAETSNGCLLAGSALGKKGVMAEKVGSDAANMLIQNLAHGGCVDEYLQDQLVLLMALAEGKSEVLCGPITLHTETAIHIAKLLTKAKFEVQKVSENSNILQCEGVGWENSQL